MILLLATQALAQSGPAWVLQDAASRDEGVAIEVDGTEVDATLPVEMDPGMELAVVFEEGASTGWVSPELLYLVDGKRSRVKVTRPGIDVATHVVRLRGEQTAAEALAAELDASVESDRDGFLVWGADDLLAQLAAVNIPAGIDEVEPVGVPTSKGRVPRRYATKKVRAPRSEKRKVRARRGALQLVWVDEPGARETVTKGHLRPHPPRPDLPGEAPPDLPGWICTAAECLVLGVDGWAHRCVGAPREMDQERPRYSEVPRPTPWVGTCSEAGAWTVHGAILRIGADRYRWVAGQLVSLAEVHP